MRANESVEKVIPGSSFSSFALLSIGSAGLLCRDVLEFSYQHKAPCHWPSKAHFPLSFLCKPFSISVNLCQIMYDMKLHKHKFYAGDNKDRSKQTADCHI